MRRGELVRWAHLEVLRVAQHVRLHVAVAAAHRLVDDQPKAGGNHFQVALLDQRVVQHAQHLCRIVHLPYKAAQRAASHTACMPADERSASWWCQA